MRRELIWHVLNAMPECRWSYYGRACVLGPVEKQERDELLAQRLQQESDREAESQAVVDVEDRGVFFCQLCYKDLSAMSHQLRTQHINR